MGSEARRRGAYGGDYLWVGLRLRAPVERRMAKDIIKLGLEKATKRSGAVAENSFPIR
jgi:hypothetical protein